VLNVTQAQQVGGRRIDLQRHDLSVTGREVVQTIVELAPQTTAPRHTHPGEQLGARCRPRGPRRVVDSSIFSVAKKHMIRLTRTDLEDPEQAGAPARAGALDEATLLKRFGDLVTPGRRTL
jgi:hypothetical protein